MTINLTKARFLILIVFLIVAIFLVGLVLVITLNNRGETEKIMVPQPPIIPLTIQPLKGAVFSGQLDTSKLEAEASVEKTTVFKLNFDPIDQTKATQLAKLFGFSSQPKTTNDAVFGTVYQWSEKNASLSISKRGMEFLRLPENLPLLKTKSPEAYHELARKILEDLNLWHPNLTPRLNEVAFFKVKGSQLQRLSGSQGTTLVSVRYDFKKNDFPLVGTAPTAPFLQLYLTANDELAKMAYQFPPNFESIGEHRLKTTIQAKDEIGNGKGVLVQFIIDDQAVMPVNFQITSITLNQMYLAYYQPPASSGTIQPVYVFEGKGTLKDGKKGRVFYYLPALTN